MKFKLFLESHQMDAVMIRNWMTGRVDSSAMLMLADHFNDLGDEKMALLIRSKFDHNFSTQEDLSSARQECLSKPLVSSVTRNRIGVWYGPRDTGSVTASVLDYKDYKLSHLKSIAWDGQRWFLLAKKQQHRGFQLTDNETIFRNIPQEYIEAFFWNFLSR